MRKTKVTKQTPRIEWWQTSKGLFNYRLIANNGETLYATNQGFERKLGMLKNIGAVAECFGAGSIQFEVIKVLAPK